MIKVYCIFIPKNLKEELLLDMKLHLTPSNTQSTWFIVSFASFLAVFLTGRGTLGEAKCFTLTQFPREHGTFLWQQQKEIIGCLGQGYTFGWGLYIATWGEAEVVEKRGRVCIVPFVCSGNFTVASGRPSDNPLQRPRLIRQWLGPHTHKNTRIQYLWKTGKAPVTISETKGKISGEWSHSHPAVHNSGTQHSQQESCN